MAAPGASLTRAGPSEVGTHCAIDSVAVEKDVEEHSQAVLRGIERRDSSIRVIARAGSGKSTLCEHGIRTLRSTDGELVIGAAMFNRLARDQLVQKLEGVPGVDTM